MNSKELADKFCECLYNRLTELGVSIGEPLEVISPHYNILYVADHRDSDRDKSSDADIDRLAAQMARMIADRGRDKSTARFAGESLSFARPSENYGNYNNALVTQSDQFDISSNQMVCYWTVLVEYEGDRV